MYWPHNDAEDAQFRRQIFLFHQKRLKRCLTNGTHIEADINPTYQDLAEHYRTTVITARSRKSKDKAKVESAVFVAEAGSWRRLETTPSSASMNSIEL
jgi:hypothetical protein